MQSGDAAKKDFLQQPFMTQQQQQQAAFQTASQFGELQGGQDAAFAQAVPVQAAAAAAPQVVAPAVIAQPAVMAAPAAASAPAVPGNYVVSNCFKGISNLAITGIGRLL